ncbi:DUF6769 family protein [Tannerella sp.]|uniref:DUF6769 family protein n=1 Tax=Tannerella sp. TaxID=2382127 RepID=UPI0026DD48F5|nr:DUF6769 family protein [Tannerella sp.]MDO4702701.1 hypothetical protein [Tannerella sp.]
MKHKRHIMQWVVWISSVFFLFSATAPHHHHDGGKVCFMSFWGDGAQHACCHTCGETSPNDPPHHHPLQTCDDCGATVSVTLTQNHDNQTAVTPILIPIFVLLNYLYPAELEQAGLFFSRKHPSFYYIEALHDTWIIRASGLRAPPLF